MAVRTPEQIWAETHGGEQVNFGAFADDSTMQTSLQRKTTPVQVEKPAYDKTSLWQNFREGTLNHLGSSLSQLSDALHDEARGSVQNLDDIKNDIKKRNENFSAYLFGNNGKTIADYTFGIKPEHNEEHITKLAKEKQARQIQQFANTNKTFIQEKLADLGDKISKAHPLEQVDPDSLEGYAQALGSVLPSAVTLAGMTAVLGAAARSGNARSLAMIPKYAEIALTRAGASAGAAKAGAVLASAGAVGWIQNLPEAYIEGQGAYKEAIEKGKSQQEAHKIRQEVIQNNILLLTPSNAIEQVLGSGLKMNAATRKTLARWATKAAPMAGNVVQNAFEEGVQTIIPARAAGEDINWDEVRRSAIVGGISGGAIHGAVSAVNKLAGKSNQQTTPTTPESAVLQTPEETSPQGSPVLKQETTATPSNTQRPAVSLDAVIPSLTPEQKQSALMRLATTDLPGIPAEDLFAIQSLADDNTDPQRVDQLLTTYGHHVPELAAMAAPAQAQEAEMPSPEQMAAPDDQEALDSLMNDRETLESEAQPEPTKQNISIIPQEATRYLQDVIDSAYDNLEYGETTKSYSPPTDVLPAPANKALAKWVRENGQENADGKMEFRGAKGSFIVNKAGTPGLKFVPNPTNDQGIMGHRANRNSAAFDRYVKLPGNGDAEDTILKKLQSSTEYITSNPLEAASVAHVAAKHNIKIKRFNANNVAKIVKEKPVPNTDKVKKAKAEAEAKKTKQPEQKQAEKKEEKPEQPKMAKVDWGTLNSGINPFQLVKSLRKYEDMTVPEAWRELKKLGKQVYDSGITNGQKWTQKMKELLGEAWGKVRPHIGKLWREVKATLSSNRGSVTFDQMSKDERVKTLRLSSAEIQKYIPAGKTETQYRRELSAAVNAEYAKKPAVQQPVKPQIQQAVKPEIQNPVNNLPAAERIKDLQSQIKTASEEDVPALRGELDKANRELVSGKPAAAAPSGVAGYLRFNVKPDANGLIAMARQYLTKNGGNFAKSSASIKYFVDGKEAFHHYNDDNSDLSGAVYDAFNKLEVAGNRFASIKDALEFVASTDPATNKRNLVSLIQTSMLQNNTYQAIYNLGGKNFLNNSQFSVWDSKQGETGGFKKGQMYGKGSDSAYIEALKQAYDNIKNGVAVPELKILKELDEERAAMAKACSLAGVDMPKFGTPGYGKVVQRFREIKKQDVVVIGQKADGNSVPVIVRGGSLVSEHGESTHNLDLGIARALKKKVIVIDAELRNGKTYKDVYVSKDGSLLTNVKREKGVIDWDKIVLPSGEPFTGKPQQYKTSKSGMVKIGIGSKWENQYPSINPGLKVFSLYQYMKEMPEHLLNSLGELQGARLSGDPVQAGLLIELYQKTRNLTDGEHDIPLSYFPFPVTLQVSVRDGQISRKVIAATSLKDGKSMKIDMGLVKESGLLEYVVANPDTEASQKNAEVKEGDDIVDDFSDYRDNNEAKQHRNDTSDMGQAEKVLYESGQRTTERGKEAVPLTGYYFNPADNTTVGFVNDNGFYRISSDSTHTRLLPKIILPYYRGKDGKASDRSFRHYFDESDVFMTEAEAMMAAQAQTGILPTQKEFLRISNISDKIAIDAIKKANHTKKIEVEKDDSAEDGYSVTTIEIDDPQAQERAKLALGYLAKKYAPLAQIMYKNNMGTWMKQEEAINFLLTAERGPKTDPNKAIGIIEAALLSEREKIDTDRHGYFANIIKNTVMEEKRKERNLSDIEHNIANRIRTILTQSGKTDKLSTEGVSSDMIKKVREQLGSEMAESAANSPEKATSFTAMIAGRLDAALSNDSSMRELIETLRSSDETPLSLDYEGEGGQTVQVADTSDASDLTKKQRDISSLMRQHMPDLKDPQKLAAFQEAFEEAKERATWRLNEFQEMVWWMHVEDKQTFEDIAAHENSTVEEVRAAIEIARAAFAEEFSFAVAERPSVPFSVVVENVSSKSQKTETAEHSVKDVAKQYEVEPPKTKPTSQKKDDAPKVNPDRINTQAETERRITKLLTALGIDQVVFFDDKNGPNGMYREGAGYKGTRPLRQIYINRSARLGVMWVAGHELAHSVISRNKGLVNTLAKVVGITDAQVAARKQQLESHGFRMSISEVREEMICDAFGNSFVNGSEGKLYEKLFHEEKPIYVKAIRAITSFVNRITGAQKSTGLTKQQAVGIEKTLFRHLAGNFRIEAASLQDFQNLLDYHHANEIARKMAEGERVSAQDIAEMEEVKKRLDESGYQYIKLSRDSETVAGTWFGKLRGVIPILGKTKDMPKNIAVHRSDKGRGELNVLYHFVSPNIIAKAAPVFKTLNDMAKRATVVMSRKQNEWTQRSRSVFSSIDFNQAAVLRQMMVAFDQIRREPVMSVRLKNGKYTLLSINDRMQTIEKAGTAERIAQEWRKEGLVGVEIVKETVIRHNEEFNAYTIIGFKQAPMQFFDDIKTAKQAANVASIEQLRRGVSFGKGEKGFSFKPDEQTITAYRELRALYDEMFDTVNTMRSGLGLEPIGYINGYMPHMFDDFWVYIDGDKHPTQTFRTTTDAIEFAKEQVEKNMVEAERVMETLPKDLQKLAAAYYGVGLTQPIVGVRELSAYLGKDAKFVAEGKARLFALGLQRNEIRICSRPVNMSSGAETQTTAFATGDMLERAEVDRLLAAEGLTLDDFEARYGALQDVSEYKGAQRSPALIKGRSKNSTGYIGDLPTITTRYINQAARYVGLNPFKVRATALFKSYFGASIDADFSKNSTAGVCKSYIQFVNGDPGWLDTHLGDLVDRAVKNSRYFSAAYDMVGGREMVNHILFFTSVAKLGLNFASAVLNFTQLANAMAVVGNRAMVNSMPTAWKVYNAMKDGKDFKDSTTGVNISELFRMFHLDTQVDLSGTQTLYGDGLPSMFSAKFWPQAAKLFKNDKQALAYELGTRSLSFFKWTDSLARITTCFATLQKEYPAMLDKVKKDNPSLSEQEVKRIALSKVAELADSNNRICNFDNSSADSALIFHHTGKVGAVALQFKKFQFKTLELLCRTFPGRNGTKEEWKKFGTLLAWQSLLSGMYGIPLYSVALSIMGYAFDWDEPETEFKREIWRMFGGTPLGNALAGHITYGGGYHIGADLSKRTGYDFLKPNDLSKLGDGGPFISTILAMGSLFTKNTDIRHLEAGNLWKVKADAMMQIFPGIGGAMQAMEGSKYSTDGRGRLIYNYSPAERLVRLAGARPLDESMSADADHYAYYIDKKTQDRQKKVITRAVNYLESGKPFPADLQEDINKYHVKMKQINNEAKSRGVTRSDRSVKAVPKKLQGEVKSYFNREN